MVIEVRDTIETDLRTIPVSGVVRLRGGGRARAETRRFRRKSRFAIDDESGCLALFQGAAREFSLAARANRVEDNALVILARGSVAFGTHQGSRRRS